MHKQHYTTHRKSLRKTSSTKLNLSSSRSHSICAFREKKIPISSNNNDGNAT